MKATINACRCISSHKANVIQECQITRNRQFAKILIPTNLLSKFPLPKRKLRVASPSCLVYVSRSLAGSFTIHDPC
jgi:hypothetical protein